VKPAREDAGAPFFMEKAPMWFRLVLLFVENEIAMKGCF
jgi:hypothetical protein